MMTLWTDLQPSAYELFLLLQPCSQRSTIVQSALLTLVFRFFVVHSTLASYVEVGCIVCAIVEQPTMRLFWDFSTE